MYLCIVYSTYVGYVSMYVYTVPLRWLLLQSKATSTHIIFRFSLSRDSKDKIVLTH